jgi:hypothetical protein
MKKLISASILFVLVQFNAKSQNTFPASGNVGIGTVTPAFPLEVKRIGAPPSGFNAAGVFNSELTGPSTGNATGCSGSATLSHASGNVGLAFGLSGSVVFNGSGTVNSIRPVQSAGLLSGSGVTSEWISFNAGFSISGAGSVTSGYGLFVSAFPAAVTNKFGVYVNDATARNYFGGSVGIGTTNPGTHRLAVEGKIGAREVRVTNENPWSDYVFLPEYKLPTLQEVEAFINKNGHLPGIPSAAEVKKEGYDLSVMDAQLLAKIEELTLHVIALNKKVDALAEENKQLKEKTSAVK